MEMALRRKLKAICGWMTPARAAALKERIRAIAEIDPQYSESRIVNEALAEYLPKLERKHAMELQLPAQERFVKRGHA